MAEPPKGKRLRAGVPHGRWTTNHLLSLGYAYPAYGADGP